MPGFKRKISGLIIKYSSKKNQNKILKINHLPANLKYFTKKSTFLVD